MKVFLTGFMGAGKSSVGRALALRLGVPFVDLDAEVERAARRPIRDIFASAGEAEFRRLEQETLKALLDAAGDGDLVLATGGGTVTLQPCRRLLRDAGTMVWLHLPFDAIAERIAGPARTERPLFRDETAARRLYESRLEVYRRCDLRVDVAPEETPEEVAERIAGRLAEVTA